jgi:stalled ribosome rescue protein Dom34
MQTYHAVLWIDHREARVFHFDRDAVERMVIHADRPSHHLKHKASGAEGDDRDFFEAIVAAIGASFAILITGPGNAKTEFVRYIERHKAEMLANVVGVETIDHPSDKELVAFARQRFARDHEILPRVS